MLAGLGRALRSGRRQLPVLLGRRDGCPPPSAPQVRRERARIPAGRQREQAGLPLTAGASLASAPGCGGAAGGQTPGQVSAWPGWGSPGLGVPPLASLAPGGAAVLGGAR